MDSNSFVYWLNGFFELSGATTLNEEQVKVIKEHIALVLHKVTPSTVQPTTPFVPIIYPNIYPSNKGWEITCETKEPTTVTVNAAGVDLNLPTCECHGTGNQEQLPIVNLTTCLTC